MTVAQIDDDGRIENYDDVTHAIARHKHLKPDGGYVRVEVDNPHLHMAPKFLRVRFPRKSTKTFNVLEDVQEMGFKIGDVYQLDRDYDEEMIHVRLDPKEGER